MSDPSRRGFLKGIGGALAAGVAAASGANTAQAAPATPLNTVVFSQHSNAHSTGRQRMMISADDLDLLVAETLGELVARQSVFTAFDVTQLLRWKHKEVNIMHPAVRVAVHRRMAPMLASRFYGAQLYRYAGGDAVRYLPA